MTAKSDPLITFVTTDYAGITRGRSVAASAYKSGHGKTLGWVPANISLTPFDLIAYPNPWGSVGDVRLLPDDNAHFKCHIEGSQTPLNIIMSDIVELDGKPWACCPRNILKSALADFESETGLSLVTTFEHEFQLFNTGWSSVPAFSLQALRQSDPFGPQLMAALREAGAEPEVFIAEYGKDQFEVTMAPSGGVVAADRAVMLREVVRELSRNHGWKCSFAPKTSVDSVGNGVHIHFSFENKKGKPVTYDEGQRGNVSAVAGSFVAGVIKHLPTLVAFTAPSPISYLRLKPHNWSSSYTWFGDCDREASLRICPVNRVGKSDPAKSFNIEYRPADACASPHLALAVLVRAGLSGIQSQLPPAPLFSGDPELLSAEDRKKRGLHRLPTTLSEALNNLKTNLEFATWFDPLVTESYIGMKRKELELAGDNLDDALCQRYSVIY